MTGYEISTLLVAIASLLTGVAAVKITIQANKINKEIAQRQGVIDLHVEWSKVSDIDFNDPVIPDIHKAINALNLTSSLWNHDVIHKSIILQSYWEPFRDLYDKFYNYTDYIAPLKKTGKGMITSDITKSYHGMRKAILDNVHTTKY